MAKYTENFKLKKPEQTDFYNIDDFNGNADIIDAELKNAKEGNEKNEESIRELVNPEFDDSGNVEGIGGFPDFLRTMVSKSNIFQFMRNAKAGFQFVLHAGQIVNNCVTDRADLPGSAAQLKVLMDLITKLNSDQDALNRRLNIGSILGQSYYTGSDGVDANKINKYFTLCKGINLPDSTSFWFLQNIIFQLGSDGFPERGKQIAYKYDGSQICERHKAYDQAWTSWNEYALKSDFSVTRSVFSLASGITQYSNNAIAKSGKMVTFKLQTANVNIASTQGGYAIATVPAGFRPIASYPGVIPRPDAVPSAYGIEPTGEVKVYGDVANQQILISGSYIVGE